MIVAIHPCLYIYTDYYNFLSKIRNRKEIGWWWGEGGGVVRGWGGGGSFLDAFVYDYNIRACTFTIRAKGQDKSQDKSTGQPRFACRCVKDRKLAWVIIENCIDCSYLSFPLS